MPQIHAESYKFCPRCAGLLTKRLLKPGEPERLVCPQCDFVFYLDPKLAVIAVVPLKGGLVLVRQVTGPRSDLWALPGGFVDLGEPLEEAVVREVLEETQVLVRVGRLLKAYSYPGVHTVVLTYITEYLSGDLAPGGETLEARIFAPGEVPWDHLAFHTTREALEDYLATRNPL